MSKISLKALLYQKIFVKLSALVNFHLTITFLENKMAVKLKDDPAVQALVEKAQAVSTKAANVAITKAVKQAFTDALLAAKGDKAATASIKMLQNAVTGAIKSTVEA